MGHLQPSNRTIIGVALLLFGAVLFGVGLHHLVATGTCSSTGYSADYGPVPHCPKGTGWWFAFVFGGVLLVVVGALTSGGSSVLLLIPAIFSAIGIGALTVAFDSNVSSGTKTFALIFGGVFAAIGLIPALVFGIAGLRNLGRRAAPPSAFGTPNTASLIGTTAAGSTGAAAAFGSPSTGSAFGSSNSEPDAILGAYTAGASAAPSSTLGSALGSPPGQAASAPRGDVLDKIAKLADLHKSGALTDDEFNREKAKLLAEI